MEPRQYQTPVAEIIFVGAVGIALLAVGVGLVVYGIMNASSGEGELIVGSIGLPLPLFLVAGALRPAALAVDDAGLRLRRIFGGQRIPWEAVRAFRVVSGGRGGPSLQAILRTGEVIWLPTPTSSGVIAQRIADELTEVLGELGGSDNE